jgi:preprotein translocase subunit SecF
MDLTTLAAVVGIISGVLSSVAVLASLPTWLRRRSDP